MKLNELTTRVRAYTRDTTGTLYAIADIKGFINEAIDKLRQIKQLEGMKHLENDVEEPILLPPYFHYMLSMYSASRCFSQDEQHYQAQFYMDDFINLFNLLELGIKEGTIIIVDEAGNPVKEGIDFDGVENVYFNKGWY